MSLRRQLLLVSLVLMVLPVGGYFLLNELERALRHLQLDTLQRFANVIERQLTQWPMMSVYPTHPSSSAPYLLAYPLEGPVVLDGYPDEWYELDHAMIEFPMAPPSGRVALLAGDDGERLVLYLQVHYSGDIYQQPWNEQSGMVVVLDVGEGRSVQFQAAAPGRVVPRWESGAQDTQLPGGMWMERRDGFSLEWKAPRSLFRGQLQVRLLAYQLGTPVTLFHSGPIPFVYRNSELTGYLRPHAEKGLRISLVDPDGWILARAGQLAHTGAGLAGASEGSWFSRGLVALFRAWVLGPEEVAYEQNDEIRLLSPVIRQATAQNRATGWAPAGDRRLAIAQVARRMSLQGRDVVLVMEQLTDVHATLSNQAIGRFVAISLGGYLLVVLFLLAYATGLSWRIRTLNRQVSAAVSPEGKPGHPFRVSVAQDEIGELSRNVGHLLTSLRGYTDYLEGFASRLAHEVKTPLAIIQSSLDNLEQAQDKTQFNTYLERTRDGVRRLAAIVRALRAASRLEQMIEQTQPEPFDLAELVRTMYHSYRDTIPDRCWVLAIDASAKAAPLLGAPDLIAQMVDKLVENAVSFTPEQGQIRLALSASCGENGQEAWRLDVDNEGPGLPEAMARDIFTSFVTMRAENASGHLGLGLVVVRLVAEYHNARVTAENRPSTGALGAGVRFSVRFPRSA